MFKYITHMLDAYKITKTKAFRFFKMDKFKDYKTNLKILAPREWYVIIK